MIGVFDGGVSAPRPERVAPQIRHQPDEVVDIFLPVRFYWVRRARWLKLHEKKNALTQDSARANGGPKVALARD
jgi:hypothetical protein